MKENVVKTKSFSFALKVISLYKYLVEEKREFVLSKQFLRSGTAVGALVREAEHAESKDDFIHKMGIALKEANETEYWIELLFQSDYIEKKTFTDISADSSELLRLLVAIVKTTRNNRANDNG